MKLVKLVRKPMGSRFSSCRSSSPPCSMGNTSLPPLVGTTTCCRRAQQSHVSKMNNIEHNITDSTLKISTSTLHSRNETKSEHHEVTHKVRLHGFMHSASSFSAQNDGGELEFKCVSNVFFSNVIFEITIFRKLPPPSPPKR